VTLGELAEALPACRIVRGDPDQVVERLSLAPTLAEAPPGGLAVVEEAPPPAPARDVLWADAGIDAAAAEAVGIEDAEPLVRFPLAWRKLVGFVPEDDLGAVRDAIFAAGAGRIGAYERCSFELRGTGTFLAGAGAAPALGERGREERVAEVRLEAVYPFWREAEVVRAFVRAHSYDEPAFDLYPLANVAARRGRGRVGRLDGRAAAVWVGESDAAARAARALGAERVALGPDASAAAVARAASLLAERTGVGWEHEQPTASGLVRLWVDGGSRGNPGPAALGYRLEDAHGTVLEEAGEPIGIATNNVAEYRALIAGLRRARAHRAVEVEVRADSQLLVRQMTGAYRVKSEALRELFEEARRAAAAFERVRYVPVPREENREADRLVNVALDRSAAEGLVH
jgi:ribonuclease HI